MIGKTIAAALMAAFLASQWPEPVAAPLIDAASKALPARAEIGLPQTVNPEVVQVLCLAGRGTAFRTGPTTLVSVDHVTAQPGCTIDGEPFTVITKSGDFSVLETKSRADVWLKIDCGGFIKGRKYVAVGYARGLATKTSIDLVAMGRVDGGFSVLWGVFTVVPGQSGGPMIDLETGKVIGTINVFDPMRGESGSIAFKDTSLCRA